MSLDGKVVSTITTTADKKQAAFARDDDSRRHEADRAARTRPRAAVRRVARGNARRRRRQPRRRQRDREAARASTTSPEHWRNQLAHRASDLVVIMLGTNEAEWLLPKGRGMARARAAVRRAARDRARREPERRRASWSRRSISSTGAERDAAARIDPRDGRGATPRRGRARLRVLGHLRVDGRHGRVARVVQARHLVKDFQHPTTPGAKKLGEALYAALVTRLIGELDAQLHRLIRPRRDRGRPGTRRRPSS